MNALTKTWNNYCSSIDKNLDAADNLYNEISMR